jgi:hypothetical protein
MSLILCVLDGAETEAQAGRPVLGPDVLLVRVVDGTSRLLDLSGRFLGLAPGTTSLLCDAMESGREAAARTMAAATGVATERIGDDLDTLISTLQHAGFLDGDRNASRRGGRTPGRQSGAFLRRLLAAAGRSTWGIRLLLGLAWVSFRALGWPRTVALWGSCTGHSSDSSEDPVAAVADAVVLAAAGNPMPVACKEKALVSWALLKNRGQAARLVLGVELFPFGSHCWCEAGGRHVADFADRCDAFEVVRIYY